MKNKLSSLMTFFSWIIIFQLALGSTLVDVAKAQEATQVLTQSIVTNQDARMAIADAVVDPAISAIAADTTFPRELDLSSNDPIVDQDPFFQNAQSWGQITGQVSGELAFSNDGQVSQIKLPFQNKVWKLKAPIHPIFATSDYVFFAANAGSDIFSASSNDGADFGEGIFYVPYNELLASSAQEEKIPVYFFPMPGTGWQATAKADVLVTEIPQHDIVVFTDTQGAPLPVKVEDLKSIAKVESVNFMMAQSMAMQAAIDKLKANKSQIESVRQNFINNLQTLSKAALKEDEKSFSRAHESIANSFGQVLTSMKSVLGTTKLTLPRGSTAGFGMLFTGFDLDKSNQSTIFANYQQTKLEKWRTAFLQVLGINTAHADAELTRVLIGVSIVLAKCAFIFSVGTALRYTVLRQKIKERMGVSGIGKNGFQVNLTVFAQSLTFVAQFPYVTSTNTIEYIMDRAGTAENGRIRKLFNATFGYSRKINNKTPVNHKTLIYGVGILGFVDTALVAFQQYMVIPWIVSGLVVIFPGLASRAEAAWGMGGNMALYNLIAVIGNLTAYISSGAYAYANQVQEISTNDALRIVADEMRKEGVNPDDPINKRLFDTRVKKMVRASLNSKGLPDERAFLFDANSFYQSIQGFFGYKPTDKSNPEEYYAVLRQGLVLRALNNAIVVAQDTKNERALVVLKGAKEDFSLVEKFKSDPSAFLTPTKIKEVAERYRNVRQELTSFTFTGGPSDRITKLGNWRNKGSNAGVRSAAQIYRKEFFSLMEIKEVAVSVGTQTAQDISPEALDPSLREGRFARWQLKRAITKANEKFVAQFKVDPIELFGESGDAAQANLRTQWEKLYRSELVSLVGLRPDSTETQLMADVEAETESLFKVRLESNASLKTYLATLSAYERARVTEIYRTDVFVQKYVDATIKTEKVPPHSPAQPGIFQGLRQTQLVRQNKVLTSGLRFMEGLFSDTRYQRGLKNLLFRTIPLVEDMVAGNLREIRRTPVEGTFGYLYNRVIWAAVLPYKQWGVQRLFRGSTISGPWATTNRILTKIGFKPGENAKGMLSYGVIGSFATFTGGIFFGLFSEDILRGVTKAIDSCSAVLSKIIPF
ncbi:MAG: hypothetical protein SGI74_00875 [Oligoflexia bacterium]|nr:hypothetical protein [Oligoflexia bacterium]